MSSRVPAYIKYISSLLLFLCFSSIKAQDTLSLQNAINIALENNYSIIIAKNDAQIATNNNTLGNAGMLPQIAAVGTQTYNINNAHQVFLSNDSAKDKTNALTNSLNSQLVLNWTIFDGFSMFITKNKLEALEKNGQLNSKLVVQNMISQVIMGYYGIAQQQKLIESLKKVLQISSERVKLAKTKSGIGVGSELTMLQAVVDKNADSSQLLQQQALLKDATIDLNKLLARNDTAEFVVSEEMPLDENLPYGILLEKVLKQNPQLIMAQSDMQVAAMNVNLARSVAYPRIGVFAGYGLSLSKSQVGIFKENLGYGPLYGVTASINIFNGFNISRNIENAKIEYLSADARLRQTELEVRSLFSKLYNEYLAQLSLAKLEDQNLQVAIKNVNISFEKLKLGAMSDIDFRTTQQKQIDAENRLLNAQYQAKIKETQLLTLSGDILNTVKP